MKVTKRHLPHITIEHSIYYVTSCIKEGLLSYEEQMIILDHIKSGHSKFYNWIAVVVMKDHIHILLKPDNYSLKDIMKGIKGVTARKVNHFRGSSGSLWQDESYDRIISTQNEFDEKLTYMLNNPVKKGYIDNPYNYHGWYLNEMYNED